MSRTSLSRRRFLTSSSAIAGAMVGGGVFAIPSSGAEPSAVRGEVQKLSLPTELRITDLRVASLKEVPHSSTIVRIDTNQGLRGWGELRDGTNARRALMLKSRLLGENPCDVDRLFRKLKQFGGHGRGAGGVCGVEMALWDLAGKAYGVPVYQLLGGKFRQRVRIYADTRQSRVTLRPDGTLSGQEAGQALLERRKRGITWLKCDMGIGLLAGIPGTMAKPLGDDGFRDPLAPPALAGIELTVKGIALLAGYVAEIREIIGMEIPLAIDHLGPISVNSAIRLAKVLEPYSLAWIEDPIPWQFTEQLRDITVATQAPILTGEDIYLKEGFRPLIERHAVDIVHPDIATAGGILETKKIGDLAAEQGIPMAIHCSGTPIHFLASVHCAAASENFLCLEHHALDVPWWESLAKGRSEPIVAQGFAKVPEGPGLGVELNEEVAREHLAKPGFFEPTPEWNVERSWDRTWS